MLRSLSSQFANPQGIFGKGVDKIMEKSNDELNRWTISLIKVKEDDTILEIGFGPGIAISKVADPNI